MTEPVTIVLLTYNRTDYAVRTVEAVQKHLRYPDLRWYVSDDGSPDEKHVKTVLKAVEKTKWPLLGYHSEHMSYGSGANKGVVAAHAQGALTLMLEDDWELREDLDLWPYAALLMERLDIGMVRMGYLNIGLMAHLEAHGDLPFWRLDDTESRNKSSYAFAGHPSLIHSRLFHFRGYYPEKWQPGETELKMAWQVSGSFAPNVVWPARLGMHGPWHHIGENQSYQWNGGVQL